MTSEIRFRWRGRDYRGRLAALRCASGLETLRRFGPRALLRDFRFALRLLSGAHKLPPPRF